ncbi:hypothetical protein GCM10009841_05870 [Microlunatus panaciterrae]|uniref:RimJ/RimL family protein N-acetyltransferase n=1 Tax=Microlunatus panaciterrae TaxID=400768 RepID=A0ABS2RJ79_9ACTN|nr:GNAT family protein [Microlunatus panaciterrae]MBM7798758.1 RimJ/RimL family protein N-acetyltransferase [Microlunatus panaciterrae]
MVSAVSPTVPPVRLHPVDLPALGRLLAGRRDLSLQWHAEYPMAETFVAGQLTLNRSDEGDPAPWGLYQICLGVLVVGDAGFHGPPGPGGVVELGYNVVPSLRRRGIATAACRQLVQLAWQYGAAGVVAETTAENVASQRVLAKAGLRLSGPEAVGVPDRAGGPAERATDRLVFTIGRP